MQVKIMKLKQSQLMEKLTCAGIEHNVRLRGLDKSIQEHLDKSKILTARVEANELEDRSKVTEAFPGEAFAKLHYEHQQVAVDLKELKDQYSEAIRTYESLIDSIKDEKLRLVDRFKIVADEHSEKLKLLDEELTLLIKECEISGYFKKEKDVNKGIVSKPTGRGRRIPKGKKQAKKEALLIKECEISGYFKKEKDVN